MTPSTRRPRTGPATAAAIGAAIIACTAPISAHAAAFALAEQNASGLGAVYAGQAALADDASAIWFNPAALTRVPGRQALLAAHAVLPRSQFGDGGSCTPFLGAGVGTTACPFGPGGNLGHAAGGDGGDASKTGVVPNLYLGWELLPQSLWLGLGVNAPFGLEVTRDPAWIGRFHSVSSKVQAININPTVAWRVNNSLALGAGIDALHFDAKLSNAVSYRAEALGSGSAALIAAVPTGSEGLARVDGNDWGTGWNAGADIGIGEAMHLAIAYRSQIRLHMRGDVRFDNRPAALASVPQLADGGITADIKLPDQLSLALSWDVAPTLRVMADWTRTGWDSVQSLDIVRSDGTLAGQTAASTPFRFRNSWRVGIGAAWQMAPQWTLRSGIARETSPVTDATRTARLPDADRTWLGIGIGYKPDKQWSFDLGIAHVRNHAAAVAIVNQDSATSAPRGSLVGSFEAKAWIVGLQGAMAF